MGDLDQQEADITHYVCGFLFVDNNVALIIKRRPKWQKGRVNGIGGKVEQGETAHEAMSREFHEEAGRLIPPEEWKLFCTMRNDRVGYRVDFFSAESDTREGVKMQEDEIVFWSLVHELPVKSLYNLQWMIPLARDPNIRKPIEVIDEGEC